ncbi:MAG: hypothetical protein MZV63_41700 [Marinilabiliales bacterium]|nr:hypothetical protein [Marinilabiliales bacterium]
MKWEWPDLLHKAFLIFDPYPQDKIEANTERVLEAVAKENPDFLSVWVSWELYVTDPELGQNLMAEQVLHYYRENDLLKYSQES